MSAQHFARHLREQALLAGCAPLLLPPRPSREPAKPFHGGLNSVLSRSTSAPRPSRTALQHWKLCHFHLGVHYLSPQISAAVAAPAGGLKQDCGPLPRGVPADPVCAGGTVPPRRHGRADPPGAPSHGLTESRFTPWSHVVSHFAWKMIETVF